MNDLDADLPTICRLCGAEYSTERLLGAVDVGPRCRAWLLDNTSARVAYDAGLTDKPPPPDPTAGDVVRLASAVARRHSPRGRVPRKLRVPIRIVTAPLWVPSRAATRAWRRARR